ncbi:MAG: hypothetical protein HC853_02975 [Anaerolineae bacterium]|nr:hypothetical protein [Anaerolineae bacterium]
MSQKRELNRRDFLRLSAMTAAGAALAACGGGEAAPAAVPAPAAAPAAATEAPAAASPCGSNRSAHRADDSGSSHSRACDGSFQVQGSPHAGRDGEGRHDPRSRPALAQEPLHPTPLVGGRWQIWWHIDEGLQQQLGHHRLHR